MARHYSARAFFRQMPNALFARYFQRQGLFTRLDYFCDPQFGLCYLRVPTWAPFRLQVHFNGHSWLTRQLAAAAIACEGADSAFVCIAKKQRTRVRTLPIGR
jgi:hypothetical protein